jgi:hypothetical protein
MSMVIGLALSVLACGGTSAGVSCNSDSECSSDVKCLHDKIMNNNKCEDEPGPGTCSLACKTNADCAVYGSTFKCALSSIDVGCNPTGECKENYTCSGNCRLAPDK